MLNGIILALLVLIGVGVAFWLDRKRHQRPDDAKLDEWQTFLIKNESDDPDKKPRTVRTPLPRDAYDTIRRFINPRLQAEYEERNLALENEICARAIQVEKVERRIASGKPMSEYDLAILRREGLMGDAKRESKNEPDNLAGTE